MLMEHWSLIHNQPLPKKMFTNRLSQKGEIPKPFNSQDLISNSPYCLPYNSYNVSLENLELDQPIIP